jgi:hypothetical protein
MRMRETIAGRGRGRSLQRRFAGPGNNAQSFLPEGETAQPQWLYPQSTVPPRHSMVHIIPDGVALILASAAH